MATVVKPSSCSSQIATGVINGVLGGAKTSLLLKAARRYPKMAIAAGIVVGASALYRGFKAARMSKPGKKNPQIVKPIKRTVSKTQTVEA